MMSVARRFSTKSARYDVSLDKRFFHSIKLLALLFEQRVRNVDKFSSSRLPKNLQALCPRVTSFQFPPKLKQKRLYTRLCLLPQSIVSGSLQVMSINRFSGCGPRF